MYFFRHVICTALLALAAAPAMAQSLAPDEDAPAVTITSSANQPLRDQIEFENSSEEPAMFSLIGQFTAAYDDDIRGASASGGGVLTQTSFLGSFTKQWGQNEFRADYAPSFDNYLQDSGLNFVSQGYEQELIHRFDKRTELDWSTQAARYSTRSFMPMQGTQFGNLTFTLPDLSALAGINEYTITTAQSELALVHRASERETWTVGFLGGASSLRPDVSESGFLPLAERFQDGGFTAGWNYALSAHTTVGVSATAAYTAQTGPTTHGLAETIEGTYSRYIGRWRLEASAGPLIRQMPKNSPIVMGNSYLLNVDAQRKIKSSMVQVGYSRSLEMGFADGTVIAHYISGSVKQRFNERLFAVAIGSYEQAIYPGSQLGGFIVSAQVGYHVSRDLSLMSSYCHGQQDAIGSLSAFDYHRNQYSAGVSYDFTRLLPHGH